MLTARAARATRWSRPGRIGKQNIAEASIDSGTSKKTELKLTNIARGSLKELAIFSESGLKPWEPNHPALLRFKGRRPATLEEVRARMKDERRRCMTQTRTNTANMDRHGRGARGMSVSAGRCGSSAVLVANGALSLLNVCTYLLKRQVARLERDFLEHGGFTERLYRVRTERRRRTS